MKQFETFGEYMFDLLFAPLKKGRKTVNQLRIFFKVMGREFDDLKAAIFRVRSEANVYLVPRDVFLEYVVPCGSRVQFGPLLERQRCCELRPERRFPPRP